MTKPTQPKQPPMAPTPPPVRVIKDGSPKKKANKDQ